MRIEYAVQLVQTNKSQAEYYECDLPAALDSLQKICEGQCLYFASVMTRYASNSGPTKKPNQYNKTNVRFLISKSYLNSGALRTREAFHR